VPYIDSDRAEELRQEGNPAAHAENVGELTFVLCDALDDYMGYAGEFRYQKIAEALGALEMTKAEFLRRIGLPYEAGKRAMLSDPDADPFYYSGGHS
jgi:hypothetical protein